MDMRGTESCGMRLRAISQVIRAKVPRMLVDRSISPDMLVVAELVRSQDLVRSAPELTALFI